MRRRLLALMMLAVITATGCAYTVIAGQPEVYSLYFREAELSRAVGSDALRALPIQLEQEPETAEALAEALLVRLLAGPEDETLRSTVPPGTELLSLRVEDGLASVDFSAPYDTLSGVALTLADYAVTLTLTQLTDISAVKITVCGQELTYRERQIFRPGDILLSPKEDVVGTAQAVLYFPDAENRLVGEERVLDLYEGDTQISAVTLAMERGPESKELLPVFPEGFRVKAAWLEEDVCYVNLSSVLIGYLPKNPREAYQVLEALGRSLCSLEAVQEVQYLVDGEFFETFAGIPIGEGFSK